MDEVIRLDVVTLQPAAIFEQQRCVLVATTSDGKTLHLLMGGAAHRDLRTAIDSFLAAHPEVVRWRSQPRH